MERTYDIFEVQNGALLWRDAVSGHEPAIARMRELAADSQNEFRLMYVPEKATIAVLAAKRPQTNPDSRAEGKDSERDAAGFRRFSRRSLRIFARRNKTGYKLRCARWLIHDR